MLVNQKQEESLKTYKNYVIQKEKEEKKEKN
jgi:hypothetical protein